MSAGCEKAPRPSRTARAYVEIKRRILGNIYPPGFQALEEELATQLGMSRTPVREALIRLEKEGLVEVTPRRGMRVVPVAPDDMAEIYDVLTCLEARAAQRLAARKPSREGIEPMIRAVDEMDAALDRQDLEAWAEADERFHRQLLELSGNRRLADMAFTVADQAHRARMVTLQMRPLPRRSSKDHRRVLDAILAGDADTAYQAHYKHRQDAMKLLLDVLERHKLSAV